VSFGIPNAATLNTFEVAVGIIIACKHHVRGEFGSNYDDLDDVLPQHISIKVNGHPTSYGSFPQCSTPPDQPYEANSPDSVTEEDHVLIHNQFRRPAIPLPLTIVHYLQSYFARQKARGFLDMCGPAGYNNLTGLLNALTLEINALERCVRSKRRIELQS
jgi:putative membrane protein